MLHFGGSFLVFLFFVETNYTEKRITFLLLLIVFCVSTLQNSLARELTRGEFFFLLKKLNSRLYISIFLLLAQKYMQH